MHEVARIREQDLNQEREAAKAYAQAFTIDPSFAPNAWALRRMFTRRGFWDNLLRIWEAEIRFAPWGRPSDCADLQVERGRVLEDRMGRDAQAFESYRAALATVSDHAGALWSSFLYGLRTGAMDDAEAALAGLLGRTTDAPARCALAITLARLQRERDGAEDGLRRAADTLLEALGSSVGTAPLLRELDQVSLLGGGGALRRRYLDAYDTHVAQGIQQQALHGGAVSGLGDAIAHQRERARILLRGGSRDDALLVLEQALRAMPSHPLLQLDVLRACEEAGRADKIAEALGPGSSATLSPDTAADAVLRRAEITEHAGAFGEALEILDRFSDAAFAEAASVSIRVKPLVLLARLRLLARKPDPEALANALVETSQRLAESDRGGSQGDSGALARIRALEAAHLLVRAATIRQRILKDTDGAVTLLKQALERDARYPPAVAALAGILAERGQYEDLSELLEAEVSAVSDPLRLRVLRETQVFLYSDVLFDARAALGPQCALLRDADDQRVHTRTVDVAAVAGDVTTAVGSLCRLADEAPGGPLAAALRILAARLLRKPDGDDETMELLRQALIDDPSSTAAGMLERQLARSSIDGHKERSEVLTLELHSADRFERHDVARALRFRLALVAASAGNVQEAHAHLEPLRREGDALADAWSLDLARRTGQIDAEIALLQEDREGATGRYATAPEDGQGPATEQNSGFERTCALAEAWERKGDRDRALDAFKEAAARGASADPVDWADVEMGIFRTHVAQGQNAEAIIAWQRLVLFLDGEAAHMLRREAALWGLSAGKVVDEGSSEAPDTPVDGPWTWLTGVVTRSSAVVAQGLEQLASQALPGRGRSGLWAAVAIRKALTGGSAITEAFTRALDEQESSVLSVAATDLIPVEGAGQLADGADGNGRSPWPAALDSLRVDRARRLVENSGSRSIAEALMLEHALRAEMAGHQREAASAYAEVLRWQPQSFEAVEGLRRLAHAVQNWKAEAAALAKQGELLSHEKRATEAYMAAALLLEKEGLKDQSMSLLTKILKRVPTHELAYRSLYAMASERGDAVLRERLIGFRLTQALPPAERVELYMERSNIRVKNLKDIEGCVYDLKRILKIDPDHVGALQALGRRAIEEGQYEHSARFVRQALQHAQDETQQAGLRLDLAEAQEGGGDIAGALSTLREAAQARPRDVAPHERLSAFAIRYKDHVLALAEMETLETLAPDAHDKAAVRVRIGRIERDGRGDPQRALGAFRRALEYDSLSEAAHELSTLIPGPAVVSPDDQAAIDRVIVALRRALEDGDPLEVRRLECLRILFGLRGLSVLQQVAAQLLAALGLGTARGRSQDVAWPLTPSVLAGMMNTADGRGPGVVAEVWPLIGEAVGRIRGQDPAHVGAGRQNRVADGSEPRLRWLEAAAHVLGLKLSLHVGGPDDLAVVGLDAPAPTLLVGRGIVGGDAGSRFRVGRALFLLRHRAASIERMSVRGIDDALMAAVVVSGAMPAGINLAALREPAKELSKAQARKDTKALEGHRARLEAEPLKGEAWRAAALRGANRFGLLVAGDLCASLLGIAGVTVLSEQELRSLPCMELIRYALSDAYPIVRREVGISEQVYGIGGRA
jgi:tetratricopeptide (TPR) repeat protein